MNLLNKATSMATSMEVNRSKLNSMEVDGSFHGGLCSSVDVGGINVYGNFHVGKFTSMEVGGCFHGS